MISALKKPFDRKKLWIILAITCGCIGTVAVFRSLMVSGTGSKWQKATDVATIAQIDKVLENNIDPAKLDHRYIMNTLLAQKVNNFIIYRFKYPKTTGSDGALYVISDNYDKEVPKAFWDNPRFAPSTQSPYCLEVVQRGQEYTICP